MSVSSGSEYVTVIAGFLLFSAAALSHPVLDYHREYPPEVFDYCIERHGLEVSPASRCMRREVSLQRELMDYLQREFSDPYYREELYQICVNRRWLQGMKRIASCAKELVEERDRAKRSLAMIEREIGEHEDRLTLMKICFGDWDASPASLAEYRTREILHCVQTRARYFRLHGRF